MELCAGGELFDSIVESGNFTEKKAAQVFQKMVEVVHHCQELGVMHRDLKPEVRGMAPCGVWQLASSQACIDASPLLTPIQSLKHCCLSLCAELPAHE